jgi:hypothetical protein
LWRAWRVMRVNLPFALLVISRDERAVAHAATRSHLQPPSRRLRIWDASQRHRGVVRRAKRHAQTRQNRPTSIAIPAANPKRFSNTVRTSRARQPRRQALRGFAGRVGNSAQERSSSSPDPPIHFLPSPSNLSVAALNLNNDMIISV